MNFPHLALRGKAALNLKQAVYKKERRLQACSIDTSMTSIVEAHMIAVFHIETEERDPPCIGDLLQAYNTEW